MTTRTVKLPTVRLAASLAALGEDRTAKVVFYSGASVERSSFDLGDYVMKFSLEKGAVKLGRMNAGAPLTRDHSRALADQVGVVERAWVEGGAARAVVRFSARPEIEALWQDVKAGVIRNVSMEAQILEMEETTPRGAPQRTYTATKWAPVALSIVTVPADAGASFHACEHPTHECVLRERDSMTTEPDNTTTPTPEERAAEKLHKAALEREGKIHRLAKHFEQGDLWAARMIASDLSIEEIIMAGSEERAKRSPQINGSIDVGHDYDAPAVRFERMASALAARATGKAPEDAARQYYGCTLADVAAECLALSGRRTGSLSRRPGPPEVKLALTTSDYPNLLGNVASKILLPQYEGAQPTYRKLARREDLPDFKTASILKVGDFPVPLQVAEAGEIKLGSFSESKDTFALATYGRRLLFSLQAIVNDDLSAFARVLTDYAIRLGDLENQLWFTLLLSGGGAGPTLGDTGALFNATAVTTAGGHANLTASGTAISVDALGVGRAMMQKQVSLDGLKINIEPRYVLTSPDKRTLAEQYVAQLAPAAPANANPFSGRLEPLSDANLSSANPWYLFADPTRAPVSVYGYLEGQAGPQVATRQGFEVLGVEMRVALHFGYGFCDFRGAYKNAGA